MPKKKRAVTVQLIIRCSPCEAARARCMADNNGLSFNEWMRRTLNVSWHNGTLSASVEELQELEREYPETAATKRERPTERPEWARPAMRSVKENQ